MQDQIQIKEVSSRRLKICHISDTHGKHKQLEIPECDVLICSGDISMMGYKHEVESFMQWIGRQSNATFKLFIAGNHDLTFDPQRGGNTGTKPDWLLDLLHEKQVYNNVFYLENQSFEIEGVKFWSSPTSAWFHGEHWAFNVRQPEADALYSTIPLGTDIVITHGPAYLYGDWCLNCACYVGDHTLDYHVRRVKPLLHFFGHIHESYGHGKTPHGTHWFNGCNCGLDYEIHNEPWLMDVDFDNKTVEILNKNKTYETI